MATGTDAAGHGEAAPPAAVIPASPSARPGIVKPHLAAETQRLYAGDWARFCQHCAQTGRNAMPASPESVAAFLATANGGRAVLSRRLAAIDHQHRQRGLLPPGADPSLRAALRQARRAASGRKCEPALTPVALERMAARCRGDLAGTRDRAVLLLLAAGLGRAAIVALTAEQLRFAEAGVTLGPGDGEREPVRLARSPAVASCPVHALEHWLRSSGTRYGPVFRKINRWGQLEPHALGADAVRLILARRTG